MVFNFPGFKYTSTFTITNESPIPVEYKIEVLGNGFLPAVQIDIDFETSLPLYPQEFSVDPEKNQILPSYSQTVEVNCNYKFNLLNLIK